MGIDLLCVFNIREFELYHVKFEVTPHIKSLSLSLSLYIYIYIYIYLKIHHSISPVPI